MSADEIRKIELFETSPTWKLPCLQAYELVRDVVLGLTYVAMRDMNDKALITVVLPVHNGMPYLPETMRSVLGQEGMHFECLTIDDGSIDGTTDYLKAIGDDRVRYVRLEKVGLVAALNEGLRLARGEWIARIDGDDVALPGRFVAQSRFVAENPDCVLIGCDFDEIDVQGKFVGTNEYNICEDAGLRLLLHFATPFLHPGVMFRRDAALAVGGYRKTHDVAEDFDLWTRIALRGRVANLPDKLMLKRIHPAAVSIVHRTRGLTQSRAIAADYARAVQPTLPPGLAGALYWFYQTGELDGHLPLNLANGFNQLLDSYQEEAGGCANELLHLKRFLRRRFGWLAVQNARRTVRQPWVCQAWLRAARQFCPERYNVSSALSRLVCRHRPEAFSGRIVGA